MVEAEVFVLWRWLQEEARGIWDFILSENKGHNIFETYKQSDKGTSINH